MSTEQRLRRGLDEQPDENRIIAAEDIYNFVFINFHRKVKLTGEWANFLSQTQKNKEETGEAGEMKTGKSEKEERKKKKSRKGKCENSIRD